ncbi:MAG: hypothetical protein ACLQLG_15745 [Thermoguttaceae bacterium]
MHYPAARRPPLKLVEKTLAAIDKHYVLSNPTADKEGLFESLTLASPEDFAALDICFTSGAEVTEQADDLIAELKEAVEPGQQPALKRLKSYDGRFDVLHFEQIADFPGEDEEPEELLDPGALLAVLGVLADLTGGIAVDPQSGTILNSED